VHLSADHAHPVPRLLERDGALAVIDRVRAHDEVLDPDSRRQHVLREERAGGTLGERGVGHRTGYVDEAAPHLRDRMRVAVARRGPRADARRLDGAHGPRLRAVHDDERGLVTRDKRMCCRACEQERGDTRAEHPGTIAQDRRDARANVTSPRGFDSRVGVKRS
jgi:hypothetical protein